MRCSQAWVDCIKRFCDGKTHLDVGTYNGTMGALLVHERDDVFRAAVLGTDSKGRNAPAFVYLTADVITSISPVQQHGLNKDLASLLERFAKDGHVNQGSALSPEELVKLGLVPSGG